MAFPGSEELVAAAEARLGRRLPEAHRERLLRENGGEVRADRQTWTLYPVWDASNRKTIARTANHIIRENEAPPTRLARHLSPGPLRHRRQRRWRRVATGTRRGRGPVLGPRDRRNDAGEREMGLRFGLGSSPAEVPRGYCPNHSTGVTFPDVVVTPLQYVDQI